METEFVFRLGSNEEPWTKAQIDDFMDELEAEMFEPDRRSRVGRITSITREDADGNETTYVKEDGEWTEE